MLTVEQRVQRGIAFLDLFAPDGWREKIDTADICMSSARKCIIGQVFGSYFDFVGRNGFDDSMIADYGFNAGVEYDTYPDVLPDGYCCADCDGEAVIRDDYTALQDEWIKVLS